jgi:hypothetical protein
VCASAGQLGAQYLRQAGVKDSARARGSAPARNAGPRKFSRAFLALMHQGRRAARKGGPVLLRCHALRSDPPRLVPARRGRTWMDGFPSRHPYRCLPLVIANAHGWELLSPWRFGVSWDGGAGADALRILPGPGMADAEPFAQSNFARGIVTLHTGYLFRTEPGWDLLATGPTVR